MPKYEKIEPMIPESLLQKLQDLEPNGMQITVKAMGPLSAGEQRLPADLVDQLRAAIPWAGRAALQLRLASTNAEVNRRKRSTAKEMIDRGASPRAVADATGVSPGSARYLGATTTAAVTVEDREDALWAGLAAIRQSKAISQTTIAQRMGFSQIHISTCERRLSSPDAGDVEKYVEILAVLLGVRANRLRRRALLAGAAIIDRGVPHGPADDIQEDGESGSAT